jgi:putative SOS response-associated peptidase YedK
MCGRFSLTASSDELVEVFDVPPPGFEIRPRYNIGPGQDVVVVGEDRRGCRLGMLRWGFVPAWAEGPGSAHANARGESLVETPSFRDAFLRRRCLVPTDGFYEWRRDGGGKTPYLFRPTAEGVLALAGIWEHWERRGHEPRNGLAILTVDANEDVAPIHHRMPVVVGRARYSEWLDRSTEPDLLRELVAPAPAGTLRFHAVSRRVNSMREDDAGLVEPV